MSVPLPDWCTPHEVTVKPRTAGGGMGPGYGPARQVRAFAMDARQIVRDPAGVEVVSESQVTIPFDEDVPVGSLVTVWGTRESEVLAVSRNHHATLPAYQTLSLA